MNNYRFTFRKNDGSLTTFGPYPDWEEAKEAFQRRYGYWPETLVSADDWEDAR